MEITVIITVKSKAGVLVRDTREVTASELAQCLSRYLSRGFEIIALEELEGSVLDFYSKRLSDDDLDAMVLDADIPE